MKTHPTFRHVAAAAFLFLFFCVASAAHASENDWGSHIAEPYCNGDTYEITTADELAWVASEVNVHRQTFFHKTIRLMNDIDLSGHEWIPIGAQGGFSGIFEGHGYSITGMEISAVPDRGYCGLFGLVSGQISNLSVSGRISCTPSVTGGMVGMLHGGGMSYCTADVDITITGTATTGGSSPRVGGLVGFARDGSISASSANCSITGGKNASNGCVTGGLVGCSQGITLSNCFAVGAISDADVAGGLIGSIYDGTVNMASSYASVDMISAGNPCGGICGIIEARYASTQFIFDGLYWNEGYASAFAGSGGDFDVSDILNYRGLPYAGLVNLENEAASWDFDKIWFSHVPEGRLPTLHPPERIPVESISISESGVSIPIGGTVTVLPTVLPGNATDRYVRWESSNETVATVNNGVITGAAPGTAAVVATTIDGGFSADCQVTVFGYWTDCELTAPPLADGVFTISAPENLAWVAYKVSTGTSFSGYTLELANDIDLSGREWKPIGGWDYATGANSSSNAFSGVFDGRGHKIRHLSIGGAEVFRPYTYCGFFGYLRSAEIKNVVLEDAEIYSKGEYASIGALAGRMEGSTLSDCAVGAALHGNAGSVGGLLGSGNGCVSGCSYCGEVSNAGLKTGGLIGSVYSPGTLLADSSSFRGDLSGKSYTGGVTGTGDEGFTLRNCSVQGAITCSGYWIGGLCGQLQGRMENSYCQADISSSSSGYEGAAIGGLAGEIYSGGIAANCYYSGDVTGYGVAQENGGSIIACYYCAEANVQHNALTAEESGVEYQMSAQQMADGSLLDKLNSLFDEHWKPWEADSRPSMPPVFASGENPNSWGAYAVEPRIEGNTIFLRTAEELAWLARQCNQGNTFAGYTALVCADIDLAGHFWIPIGSKASPYQGSLDGNGYSISNLRIGSRVYPRQYENTGLFGYCREAQLYSVTMENAEVHAGGSCSGILVGYALNTGIRYNRIGGRITAGDNTGAVAGLITGGDVCFKGNFAQADVAGRDYAGGLAGLCANSVSHVWEGLAENGFSGSVSGNDYVGGIAGKAGYPIVSSYSRGCIAGLKDVGGIVGYTGYQAEDCFSTCDVTGSASVGGIVGNSTVENGSGCYWSTDAVHTIGGYPKDDFEKKGVGSGKDLSEGKSIGFMQGRDFFDLLESPSWEWGQRAENLLPSISCHGNDAGISLVEIQNGNGAAPGTIEAGEVTACVRVQSYRGCKEGTLMMAAYDFGGRLAGVQSVNVQLSSGEDSTAEFTMNLPDDAGKIKFFFLSDTYTPFCGSMLLAN